LSGGNQQKVLLARWLEVGPRVLILDEPTRGVDVGAKAEIYRIVAGLAARGLAIVLISSELPELLGLSHRILVMRGGRQAGIVEGAAMDERTVMRLAAGLEADRG
jgi:ABC-type sugar transport system ATPase subunit